MSYTNKTLEELNVLDDFLMNAIVATPVLGEAFCRNVLTVLLQKKIKKIHVKSQRIVPPYTPKLRGIRMDVEVLEYADETMDEVAEIYDIEPNLRKNVHLPRHNRFYQAKVDGSHLKSGDENFDKLPNLYVITITNYDPFGYDYMMYRIKNCCKEIPELAYDDGLEFLYFYTGGHKGGNESIKAMLNYFQNSRKENVTTKATEEINEIVDQIRNRPEVRNEYMTLGDIIDMEREEAAADATAKATEILNDTTRNHILMYFRKKGTVPDIMEDKLRKIHDTSQLQYCYEKALEISEIGEYLKFLEGYMIENKDVS